MDDPGPRSSVYRGSTRQEAEYAYHAEARAAVRDGYVPASEDWSTALGQQVLTVRYVYAPDQASAVLDALAGAEKNAAARPPVPARAQGGQTGFAAIRSPEPPAPAAAAQAKRSVTPLLLVVVVALVALGAVVAMLGIPSIPSIGTQPQAPAANRPPVGQVWFGRSFDATTFAVQLRLNSAGPNDPFVAVAALPRVVDASQLLIRAYLDDQLVASQQINATGSGDVWGINLGPVFAPGIWRYEFADIGGNVLAKGEILIK